jgi:hypothetical protein
MKWGQVERRMAKPKSKPKTKPQLLHLVFGGELKNTGDIEFKDLSRLDIVGMYPNFAQAKAAWLGKAQATVDNAQMRYFVAHIHRLFEAEEEPQQDDED